MHIERAKLKPIYSIISKSSCEKKTKVSRYPGKKKIDVIAQQNCIIEIICENKNVPMKMLAAHKNNIVKDIMIRILVDINLDWE